MTKTLEQLYKERIILEQRLHNFEKRNENLEGNFVGQIRNLKRRLAELEEETKDEEMENRFRFRVWCKELKKFQYFQFNTKDGCSLPHSNWFNEKEPIQQCTGIKDKFGNLIYEGDIVREINITGRDEEYINEVKWVKGGFDINVDPDFSLEIIGNIYENKELLEEI